MDVNAYLSLYRIRNGTKRLLNSIIHEENLSNTKLDLSFYFSADLRLSLCCSQLWFEQGSGSEHTEGTIIRGKDATTISSVHLDVTQDLCMGGRERYAW